jgi:GDSL-like Lipase/Acylhydrolase family
MKRWLVPLAVASVSTLAALAAAELAVRALFRQQAAIFPRYHTDYRYGEYTLRGIRPNARFRHTSVDGSWEFVTNSKGLRDHRDYPYEKPAGTLRVLALGDSHTQGYEVRQQATYSAVLERYLAARGIRAEVLNAGVSGFSTAEALAYLENEGHRYHPDVVVLGFYANDFSDNLKAGLFELERAQPVLVARKREHIPGVRIQNALYAVPGVRWLGENSYFYSLLFNSVWIHAKTLLRARAVREGQARSGDGDFEYAVATTDTHSPYAVALTLALIERMREFCRARDIRFIVVEIPRPRGPYRMTESLPAEAARRLADAKIELVSSRALLGQLDGVAEMHLPAGQNHISEFTHTLIAVELGQRINAIGLAR